MLSIFSCAYWPLVHLFLEKALFGSFAWVFIWVLCGSNSNAPLWAHALLPPSLQQVASGEPPGLAAPILQTGQQSPGGGLIEHSGNVALCSKSMKNAKTALAGVAQCSERQPANQRVVGSIPNQGMCLSCRPSARGKRSMFLSLSFCLPSPLSKI